jgi:hypothetical protein
MTEEQASYEDVRFGSVPFQFPGDEPRAPSQEAIELCKDALNFVMTVVRNSRTSRAALLKLACVHSMFGGGETSQEIAKRFRVSTRAVQMVMKDLRKEFLGRSEK